MRRMRSQGIDIPSRSGFRQFQKLDGPGTISAQTQAASLSTRSIGFPSLRPSQMLMTSFCLSSQNVISLAPSSYSMRAREKACKF